MLSIVIPARNEEGPIRSTVEHLHVEMNLNRISHEIVVIDDGSTDDTFAQLAALQGWSNSPAIAPLVATVLLINARYVLYSASVQLLVRVVRQPFEVVTAKPLKIRGSGPLKNPYFLHRSAGRAKSAGPEQGDA